MRPPSSWWMRIWRIARSRECLRGGLPASTARIARPNHRRQYEGPLGLTIQKRPRRPSPMHMWMTASDPKVPIACVRLATGSGHRIVEDGSTCADFTAETRSLNVDPRAIRSRRRQCCGEEGQ